MVVLKGEGRSRTSAAERVGVLVLGMHRSGTSALARVLNLLGCDLPKTLVQSAPSNEAGHWESLPIARFNDRILESAGSTWWDWMPFNPGWYSSPKAADFKEEALSLLDDEFGGSRLFVLKDPRICRFAPFWIDVLHTAKIRPAAVMQLRNPLEVAESLARRNGFHTGLGQLLWLRNVLEAEAATREITRYRTSYDVLLNNWPRIATASQEALKVSWPRLSVRTGGEINSFLSGPLRHHHKSSNSVLDNSLLSDWLRETFAILNRWAENGETSEDQPTLDRIRAELDVASPAFSQLISLGKYSADRSKTLEASLTEIQDKLTVAESAVEAKLAQIHSLEQDQLQAAETAAQLAEAKSELAKLQTEIETQRTDLDEGRGRLSHLQSELAQRQAEADDATKQLQVVHEQLEAERERHVAELHELEQRFAREAEAEREKERAALKAGQEAHAATLLEERKRHLAELRAERERHTDELLDLRERHDKELTEHRTSADRELQKLRRLKDQADERVAERFRETATLTRLLSERERQVQISDEKAARLHSISTVLLNGSASRSLKSRIGGFLPAAIRFKKQKSRLKHAQIFDCDAYLEANPDVAEAGVDPLWHYLNHGCDEGRQLQRTPANDAQGE